MNTRLPQDAADSLTGYESQQAWRDAMRLNHAKSQPYKLGPSLVIITPPEELAQRAQDVADGTIPF